MTTPTLETNQPSYLTKTDFTVSNIYVSKGAVCLSFRNKLVEMLTFLWASITLTSFSKHFFVLNASAHTSVMRRKNLCCFGSLEAVLLTVTSY